MSTRQKKHPPILRPAIFKTTRYPNLQRFGVRRAFHIRGNGFKIRRRPNFVLFVLHKLLLFRCQWISRSIIASRFTLSSLQKNFRSKNKVFYPLRTLRHRNPHEFPDSSSSSCSPSSSSSLLISRTRTRTRTKLRSRPRPEQCSQQTNFEPPSPTRNPAQR
jgi:hypothetical protein